MNIIEIGHSNLNDILYQLNNLKLEPKIVNKLIVDFSHTSFIKPYKLAIVSSFIEMLRSRFDINVQCVNLNSENESYIARMNFFKEMSIEYSEKFWRHDPTGRFIPITRINESNRYNLTGKVLRIMEAQWEGIDQSIIASLNWSVQEIIDNIFNHSGTRTDGFITAQYYPKKKEIDLIILDNGIGIAERLRQNPLYSHIDNITALDLAIQMGVTVNKETNVGAGLYYTKRIIEENQGKLIIYSKDANIKVTQNDTFKSFSPEWQGTMVRLKINTDHTIDPAKVWDNIPPTVLDYTYDGTLW